MRLSAMRDVFFEDVELLLRALARDPERLAALYVNRYSVDECAEFDFGQGAELSLSSEELQRVFRASTFIGEDSDCATDGIRELLSQLKTNYSDRIEITDETEQASFRFFERIAPTIEEEKLDARAFQMGAPILKGLAVSPILKFRRSLISEAKEISPENYAPAAKAVESFLVELSVATGARDEYISFQIDEKRLVELKQLIGVAEIEMAALKSLKRGE